LSLHLHFVALVSFLFSILPLSQFNNKYSHNYHSMRNSYNIQLRKSKNVKDETSIWFNLKWFEVILKWFYPNDDIQLSLISFQTRTDMNLTWAGLTWSGLVWLYLIFLTGFHGWINDWILRQWSIKYWNKNVTNFIWFLCIESVHHVIVLLLLSSVFQNCLNSKIWSFMIFIYVSGIHSWSRTRFN
jgi:hypothetical protein